MAPTLSIDIPPDDQFTWWCPICKQRRGKVLPATKPLNGYGPRPRRCPKCDSTLVLKKVERAE